MTRKTAIVIATLFTVSIALPTVAKSPKKTGNPELVVVNRAQKTVVCRVVAYSKNKRHGNYTGTRASAKRNESGAAKRFINFEDRGALCYFPADYKRHPYRRPNADSTNIAGNRYARTEKFGDVGDGRITITCYSSLSRCTVTRTRK